ncbi:MAG: MgtC/SapB family protein, partial [Microbacteriaceae bacterium]|nr:MgtC/SapB family protein [Microbacteriaceae bacterium]
MLEDGLLQRTALAVAIGLLIGIQRGWQKRQLPDGGRVAGIRTFTLIGLLGGLCGLLSRHASPLLAAAGLLSFALPFGFFEWNKARGSGNLSATNFVTGLLTFVLGAYAVIGDMTIAAAGGVVTAAILS